MALGCRGLGIRGVFRAPKPARGLPTSTATYGKLLPKHSSNSGAQMSFRV